MDSVATASTNPNKELWSGRFTCKDGRPSGALERAVEPETNMTKKILVVDDSASVRQQVGLALAPVGFEVVEAVDGVDGLKHIEGDAQLSMVLCDVNMPRMNGLEMLEKLRDTGLRPGLPVLMLTTESQPALLKRAQAAGAKGWIVKPFKANILVATVQKLTA